MQGTMSLNRSLIQLLVVAAVAFAIVAFSVTAGFSSKSQSHPQAMRIPLCACLVA